MLATPLCKGKNGPTFYHCTSIINTPADCDRLRFAMATMITIRTHKQINAAIIPYRAPLGKPLCSSIVSTVKNADISFIFTMPVSSVYYKERRGELLKKFLHEVAP